jgi:hypothetical protein
MPRTQNQGLHPGHGCRPFRLAGIARVPGPGHAVVGNLMLCSIVSSIGLPFHRPRFLAR